MDCTCPKDVILMRKHTVMTSPMPCTEPSKYTRAPFAGSLEACMLWYAESTFTSGSNQTACKVFLAVHSCPSKLDDQAMASRTHFDAK